MINILNRLKMQVFIKMLHKLIAYFLYKKNIIILIGDKGTFLCALVHDKVVGSLFVPDEKQNELDSYKEFFAKFKKHYVFFLLSGSECQLRHELVPVLHSIVTNNPVEKFIEEYFPADYIVGYSVYNINTKPSEVWNSLIVSSPYTPPLSKLLENLLASDSQKFGGIYFLSLELQTIIDKIVKNVENNKYSEYLQIFVCILNTSGIKLVVKHQGNIISKQTLDYPADKSDSYIQGIIEQEVEDCLISCKNYIANLALKVCIIFIVDQNLKLLLEQSNFAGHPVICIVNSGELDNKFSDGMIVKLFNEQKSFLASNQYLESIAKLNLISSLVFKPLITIIIILIFAASIIKVKTVANYKKLDILNSHYFSTEQDYYNVKQTYPYLQNATNLADLYVFESLLQIPAPIPFDLLEKFVTNLPPSIHIEEVKWQRLDLDNTLSSSNQYIKIGISLRLIVNDILVEEATKFLEQEIANFSKIFSNMDIKFTIFTDQILDLSNRVVIPASVIITKKKG
ncbi:hypothetical protein [Candidatus Tisiphia endosymbiont of Sialis lutaria]|uniref:hypothetical protein n=1 Tax=Candidatus Tisiphia endosymbiont of Sialis lutaria TaxID=2029164 RepID=UPI00312C8AEF